MDRPRVPALARRPGRSCGSSCRTRSSCETYDGSAWLGIVPVPAERLRGCAALPPLPRSLDVPGAERAHLRHPRRPAGHLVLLARRGEPLAVEAAKRLYKLPYHRAQMRYERVGDVVQYESATRRRARSAAATAATATCSTRSPVTLEHFLTERYCLYTEDGGRLYRAEIHHPPWDLQRGEARIDLNTMAPLPLPDERPHVLFCAAAGRRASGRSTRLEMTPQRRSALVSVAAAATLVVLKLCVGLATHSLGLVSEAVHSGHRPRRGAAHVLRDRVSPRGRPTSRTSSATARPSTSRRSPRRGSSSLASVFISSRARSSGSPASRTDTCTPRGTRSSSSAS